MPATSELKTMLPLGAKNGWSVGSLDTKTLCLYAELFEEAYGNITVAPPSMVVRLGLTQSGVAWVLRSALYG